MEKRDSRWYRLDNAGVLYSALQKEEYSATYRFSALMAQPVRPDKLQQAIYRTMPRFPGFAVRIRRGAFWYYLEPNPAPGPFLKPDVSSPCQPFRFHEDNGWLVRFYYYKNRISIEVFHALSDGTGATTFLRTLLAVYLRLCGCDIPPDPLLLEPGEIPPAEELEDAYQRYAGHYAARLKRMPRAYLNVGTPEPFYTFHVTMGFVPLDALRLEARRHGVSCTEYLAAVLLHVLLEKQAREHPYRKRPAALAIPVDLRRWFPSKTLRNFITTLPLSVDPAMGEYTFPELLAYVHHDLRLHLNRQELQSVFTRNVRFTRMPLLQIVPMVLKAPVMSWSYQHHGVLPFSCTYTNPGAFPVPESMRPHITGMEVVLGQTTIPRCHCASISYGNTMEITFSGTQAETETERDFFRFLVRAGIPVRIESNR